MKRWLMKYLCCCCRSADTVDDVTPEELERELEAFRQKNEKEQRLRREALERAALKKQQTQAAQAFAEYPRLEGTRVDIDDDARTEFLEVFGIEPAAVVNQLVKGVGGRVPVTGNLKVSVTQLKGGGVTIEIALKDADADPSVETSYSIHTARLAFSGKFTPGKRGTHMHLDRLNAKDGTCKPFFAELLPLCQNANVMEMSTHATEIGAYAWVRYGFRPNDEGEYDWSSVCKTANARLDDLEGRISEDAMTRARKLLTSTEPTTIEEVANLNDPVDGRESRLGFVLLELNTWDGEFDLTDADRVAQVMDYITPK